MVVRRSVVLALLLAVALPAVGEPPNRIDMTLPPHGTVSWERSHTPVLWLVPHRGEGWYTLAARVAGGRGDARGLMAANPRLDHPLRDRPVAVPVELLRGDLRLAVVKRLFPADRRVAGGWEHRVLDPFGGGEESWEWLAAVFAGDASRARVLRAANPGLARSGPGRMRTVTVPDAALLRVFRNVTPAVPTATLRPTPPPVTAVGSAATPLTVLRSTPTLVPATARPPVPASAGSPLEYGQDSRGRYAVYRLRRGEALYSAVVVRFTGQLHAAEVNATAAELAKRSNIRDVTAIPVGYPIKIPLDMLLPEYLPAGDPRRREWEAGQRELSRFVEVVHAVDLSGVHVILDAGHGGSDTGAVVGGVWESVYAYDLMCRVKRDLERYTRATVWTTIGDSSRHYEIPAENRLPQDRDQFLLTHPAYRLDNSSTGVHLRWYLTNSIVNGRLKQGVHQRRTVFVSIHADSLHPSVRGAMVYVPSRHMRPTSFTVRRDSMKAFREYRDGPTVTLSPKFMARAEASSRRLAEKVVDSLEREGVAVHPYEPIRDRVLRGRRTWVPAVLRYTLAQNAILLECCNLANDEDRAALLDQSWRERFARAVVAGIAAAFDGS